jgi:hypothetical protein
MPMSIGWRRALLCAALACLYVPAAHADPIRVTGGSLGLNWDGSPTGIRLTGTNLSIVGNGGGSGTSGWQAGTLGNLDGLFSFSDFRVAFDETVGGVVRPAFLAGALSFQTRPFLVPPTDAADAGTFRTRFDMTGEVRGYGSADGLGTPLFDLDLFGTGTAFSQATPIPGSPFYISQIGIVYTFDPASPTPEPATLLLLVTGVAGIAGRRRRHAQ